MKLSFDARGTTLRRVTVTIIAMILTVELTATGYGNDLTQENEVTLIAVGIVGDDPFTAEPVGTDEAGVEGAADGGSRTGDRPGLYGGTRKKASCDKEQLIDFLTRPENKDKADAWAKVLRISRAEIPTYIRKLTALILRYDILVKNHGFKKGIGFTIFYTLLEAGIAILVNEYGIPTVRCSCGNPLTAPDIDPNDGDYDKGTPWKTFNKKKVTVIEKNKKVDDFVFRDVSTDEIIARKPGSNGDEDRDSGITITTTIEPSPIEPSPIEPSPIEPIPPTS